MNDQDQPSSSSAGTMHLPALLAASFAALVGAVAWGLIAWTTGYEVGYVAWGIGGLVGFAAVKLGGRGIATASTAAALTLVALFIGKVLGTHFLVEKEFVQVRDEYFTAALFEELQRDADAWGEMPATVDDQTVRQFMVDHEYGGFGSSEEIAPDDLQYFYAFSVPVLEQFESQEPSFEAWQSQSLEDYRADFEAEFSLAQLVVQELNALDLIFAALAVSTAFGMINRASQANGDGDAGDQDPPMQYEERRAA